jgi:hypothetical protein
MNPARMLLVGCLAALSLTHGALARGEEQPAGYRSPETAFLYSFLGTAVPVGVGAALASSDAGDAAGIFVLGGVVIGPSMGHFYASRPGRAWAGIGVRTLCVTGLAALINESWNNPSSGADALGATLLVVGSGMAVFDIATASRSARAHNAELSAARWTVSPTLVGQAKAPGLRVDITY